MCMFFILQVAQRGYERGLRGIQRLLCTLLCTRSNTCKSPIHPSATPPKPKRNPRRIASAENCTSSFAESNVLRSSRRCSARHHLEDIRREIPRISAPLRLNETDLVDVAIRVDGMMEIDRCSGGSRQSSGWQQFSVCSDRTGYSIITGAETFSPVVQAKRCWTQVADFRVSQWQRST